MSFSQDQKDSEIKLPWEPDTIEGEERQLIVQGGAVPVEAWLHTSKDKVHEVRLVVTNEPSGPANTLETMVRVMATTHARRRLPTDYEVQAAINQLQLEVVDRSVIEKGRPLVLLFGRLLAAA